MRCKAHRTDGQPCGNWAIKGGQVCRYHGGSSGHVKAAAQRRLAEQEAARAMAKYAPDRKPLENPVEALLSLASEIEGWRKYMAGKVAELESADWRRDHRAGEQLHAMIALYERSLDRAGRILTDINKLGLESRRVRLQEQQVEMAWTVIQAVMNRMGLGDDPRVNVILGEELNRLAEAEARADGGEYIPPSGHPELDRYAAKRDEYAASPAYRDRFGPA